MEVRKKGEIWAVANFLQHKTNNREESNIILHTEYNKAKSTNINKDGKCPPASDYIV